MSLILDALHKADSERRKKHDEPPGLDSQHDPIASAPKAEPWRLWLMYGGGLVLIIALSIGAYYWGKTSSTTNTSASTEPRLAKQAQPQNPPNNRLPTSTQAVDDHSQADISAAEKAEAARLYERKPEPTREPEPQRIATPEPQLAVRQATPMPTAPPTPTPRPVATATPAPTPSPTPPPRQSSGEPEYLADFPAIGDIRSLAWTTQEKIPSLTYSEHIFAPENRGYVVINGAKKKTGDQLERGLVIESILRDGILLKYEGETFKVPALNSWVNM